MNRAGGVKAGGLQVTRLERNQRRTKFFVHPLLIPFVVVHFLLRYLVDGVSVLDYLSASFGTKLQSQKAVQKAQSLATA